MLFFGVFLVPCWCCGFGVGFCCFIFRAFWSFWHHLSGIHSPHFLVQTPFHRQIFAASLRVRYTSKQHLCLASCIFCKDTHKHSLPIIHALHDFSIFFAKENVLPISLFASFWDKSYKQEKEKDLAIQPPDSIRPIPSVSKGLPSFLLQKEKPSTSKALSAKSQMIQYIIVVTMSLVAIINCICSAEGNSKTTSALSRWL